MRRRDHPEAIGANQPHAMACCDLDDLVLKDFAGLVEFTELRRDHDTCADASSTAFLDHLPQLRNRYRDQGKIDRPRCRCDIRIGATSQNSLASRIDRQQFASITMTDDIVHNAAAELRFVFRCADDRHRMRLDNPFDRYTGTRGMHSNLCRS